jgi:hypothetical protein
MKRTKTSKRISLVLLSSILVFTLLFGTAAQASAATAPAAFAKSAPVKSAVNQATDVTLTWSVSSGATRYEYCVDSTNDSACSTSWVSAGTKTSVKVKDLAAGTTYYWQVRAVNSTGTTYANGKLDYFWKFSTGTTPRTFNKKTVANHATDVQKSITLTWGTSANAKHYEYCIDTTDNDACDTQWVSTGTSNKVTLTNLKHSTSYYWQVRAVNSAGTVYANGSKSEFWKFKTGYIAKFQTKYPASGATGVPTSVTLKWGPSTPYTTYEYCIDTTNNKACDTGWISTGYLTSVTLSLDSATKYYWLVRATNSWGTNWTSSSKTGYSSFTTE